MQISGLTHSASSTSRADRHHLNSFDAGSVNFGSPKNTLFQNLLKNPVVQDNVTLNEDGTHSFGGEIAGEHDALARLLISEQNRSTSKDLGAVSEYSLSDLTKFRQLTGYNLVQAAGMYTVVDDHGRPPAMSDQALAQAAWDMFDLAKGAQDLRNPGTDLSLDELRTAAEGLRSQPGADQSLFDALIEVIDANLF